MKNKISCNFSKKKLFLFDMDGTIYEDNVLFDGCLELLSAIKKNNANYVFITNNSSKSVNDYVEKLFSFGINVTENNFFTSTQAAIYFLNNNYRNSLIYCQGTQSFIQELINNNVKVTTNYDDKASAILVGFDTELTSEKIRSTCKMLNLDIPFYATNPDLACPVSFGFIPDCGSICQMLTNATHKKPLFLGKPEPIMVELLMEKFRCSKEDVIVIGDRLYTDIAVGVNAKVETICVLTGEATKEEIEKSSIKPDYVMNSIKDIIPCMCDAIEKK